MSEVKNKELKNTLNEYLKNCKNKGLVRQSADGFFKFGIDLDKKIFILKNLPTGKIFTVNLEENKKEKQL